MIVLGKQKVPLVPVDPGDPGGPQLPPDVKATLTSPSPESTLTANSATFTWSSGTNALAYRLQVGTASGGGTLFDGSYTTFTTSKTVSGLPVDGSTLYVRLWTQFTSSWRYTDYTLTAQTIVSLTKGEITFPANGAQLLTTNQNFAWSAGSGATGYVLVVGSRDMNHWDIYRQFDASVLECPLTLPGDGRTLYVRLWTRFATGEAFSDYTYTAYNPSLTFSQILEPFQGQNVTTNPVHIHWSAGLGYVLSYRLLIGTTGLRSTSLLDLALPSTVTSIDLPIVSSGEWIYITLITLYPDDSLYSERQFSLTNYTGGIDPPPPERVPPTLISPMPSQSLSDSAVLFRWSAGSAGVYQYKLQAWADATPSGISNLGTFPGTTLSASLNLGTLIREAFTIRLSANWQNSGWLYRDYSFPGNGGNYVLPGILAPSANTILANGMFVQWQSGTVPGGSQIGLVIRDGSNNTLWDGGLGITENFVQLTNLPNTGAAAFLTLGYVKPYDPITGQSSIWTVASSVPIFLPGGTGLTVVNKTPGGAGSFQVNWSNKTVSVQFDRRAALNYTTSARITYSGQFVPVVLKLDDFAFATEATLSLSTTNPSVTNDTVNIVFSDPKAEWLLTSGVVDPNDGAYHNFSVTVVNAAVRDYATSVPWPGTDTSLSGGQSWYFSAKVLF
jgi:hypothetical protein